MSKYYDFGVDSAVVNKGHNDNGPYYNFGVSSRLVNEQLQKSANASAVNETEVQLATYKELASSGKVFSMTFDKISESGDLSSVVNGVTVTLPNKGADGKVLFNSADRNERAERLVLAYSVKVISVDEDAKSVTLATLRLNNRDVVIKKIDSVLAANKAIAAKVTQAAKDRVDSYMEQESAKFAKMSPASVDRFRLTRTNEEITNGYRLAGIELITVPARVTKVEDKFLICDIMGFNIPGKLFRNDWSFHANGNLATYVQLGDVIDVCIKGLNNNKTAGGKLNENKAIYLVTRLPLLDNPWEHLELKKDDDIKATCVDIKKNCWFGSVNGTELEVYGEYAQENGITVRLGETYLCHVYRCDAEMRSIRVRPIKHLK